MKELETQARALIAECYGQIAKLPEDDHKAAWGLLAMALCNVLAALTSPDLIRLSIEIQADATHRGMALIEKLEQGDNGQDWAKA